ncbi:Glycosyltransferase involved in cell wall bisynthesis [Prevotella sp. khp1]|uniref:glycosyltransferase family 4 protein n=1 Tax=Prevotellaceae TaxID=171552 RepID=UPI0008832AD3|nr:MULTISPECIES: glycosyltransferase family 4 protein [Prevotellaceae]QVJ80690.1 glycosyltransferase family 4 protein [Xylanibacter ruminicola]SDQ15936.1 Glycosyltransferase involved in cell wall bisynthesis [Prevotella sp. khp1]
MKLLYITKSFAAKAGVERVLSDKMNWLAEHGYDIMLVTYEQGNHPDAFTLHPSIKRSDLDARFFKLSSLPELKRFTQFLRLRKRFVDNLQKQVDFFRPDIIITTTYQLKLLDLITKVKTNAKKVLESHIACYKAKKTGDFPSYSLLRFFAKVYDAYFLKRVSKFDQLVALTKGDANDWERYIKSVLVIPNPITFYPEKNVTRQSENIHRIIAVGRLNEQKGFDLLIEAFSKIANKCPKWNVDIFGDGSDKEKLLNMISNYHMESRVSIYPSTSDIYREYCKSDILVLSSRYEGYPLVLNEAMSCSLPCVAFRCKYGPEDAITNGENGILVTNGDTAELAESILWLINHNEARLLMGDKARHSSAKYKKDLIMKEWVELFDSIIR